MNYGYHLRKEKFGKKEQHMERKLRGYLSDIDEYSGGLMLDVRKFTMKNGSILDTEKVKEAAKRVLDIYEDITDKKERDFYIAYFYCSFVLTSIEFKFLDRYSQPRKGWYCIHPPFDRKRIPMKKVAEIPNPDTWQELYSLLSGNGIEIPYKDIFAVPEATISEEREMNEDIEELNASLDWDEINRENEELYYSLENSKLMSEEEINEWNTAESKRIKLYYPGYKDFIKYSDTYVKLYPKYRAEYFENRIREMIEYYMLAEGHSIYDDEKKYLEVMIQLNRARKLLKEYMGGKD